MKATPRDQPDSGQLAHAVIQLAKSRLEVEKSQAALLHGEIKLLPAEQQESQGAAEDRSVEVGHREPCC